MLSSVRDEIYRKVKQNRFEELSGNDLDFLVNAFKSELPQEHVKRFLESDVFSGVVSETSFFDRTGIVRDELCKMLKKIMSKRGVI